jgi:hypothetical protein
MDEIIKKYFYDIHIGFVSSDKLYRKIKADGYDVKLNDVKTFYDNQEIIQKTKRKPLKVDRVYNTIVASGYGANYQIDIIVYDRWEYHKYKYILCVIDVYSRYASCRAMTSRKNETILEELKSIFAEMGVPRSINCDNEFDKGMLNDYFNQNDITCYFSQADEINKNAIVERFNRTLSGLLNKYRLATGQYNWYAWLNDVVNNYNTTYHRMIKTTPLKIKEGSDKNHQDITVVTHDFKIGDKVRACKHKNVFSKSDELLWSDIIYTVTEINKNKIYISNNNHQLKNFYKPYELMKLTDDVGVYDNPETDQEVVHVVLKKEKKINKLLKQAGIEQVNDLADSKRIKKPSYKMMK